MQPNIPAKLIDHKLRDVFLDELNGSVDTNFHRLFSQPGDLSRRVVFRNEHFWIIPALGPIGDAHFMILPCQRCSRFADLPHERRVAFETAYTWLVRTMTDIWCSPLVFEHGASRNGQFSGGRCTFIELAHLHLVCVNFEFEAFVSELSRYLARLGVADDGASMSVEHPAAMVGLRGDGGPYLFVSRAQGPGQCFPLRGEIESQFLRRFIARKLRYGPSEWNWRTHPKKEKVAELVLALRCGEDEP